MRKVKNGKVFGELEEKNIYFLTYTNETKEKDKKEKRFNRTLAKQKLKIKENREIKKKIKLLIKN